MCAFFELCRSSPPHPPLSFPILQCLPVRLPACLLWYTTFHILYLSRYITNDVNLNITLEVYCVSFFISFFLFSLLLVTFYLIRSTWDGWNQSSDEIFPTKHSYCSQWWTDGESKSFLFVLYSSPPKPVQSIVCDHIDVLFIQFIYCFGVIYYSKYFFSLTLFYQIRSSWIGWVHRLGVSHCVG